VWMRGVLWSSF